MRRFLLVMLMLAMGPLGCDTSDAPAPKGAENAETSLDVDMGSDDAADASPKTGDAEPEGEPK